MLLKVLALAVVLTIPMEIKLPCRTGLYVTQQPWHVAVHLLLLSFSEHRAMGIAILMGGVPVRRENQSPPRDRANPMRFHEEEEKEEEEEEEGGHTTFCTEPGNLSTYDHNRHRYRSWGHCCLDSSPRRA